MNIPNKLNAWKEIIKIGKNATALKQVNVWFRNNIMKILENESWMDFFVIPRSLDEIMEEFSYTDKDYLLSLLGALESDKTITKIKNGKYQIIKQIKSNGVKAPDIFENSVVEIFNDYANAIPDRLKGKYLAFSGSFNLFNWDDWLINQLYEAMRSAAFAFTPETLKKPGIFLDGGCGTGIGTSAIWLYYLNKGDINSESNLKLYGLDNNEDFINIANEEFDRITAYHKVLSKEEVRQYKEFYPKFKVGSISEIPFEDNFFDYVYTSQVLHWTDVKKTINDIYRVLNHGGIYFGTNQMLPRVDRYLSLHIKVAQGAQGSFSKEDMTKWLTDAGFSKIQYATPAVLFRAEKI